MKTAIDSAGRVVIPKEIRDAAGLRPGQALEVTCVEGRIEIEPAVAPVELVKKGRFLVARPAADVPPLLPDTAGTLWGWAERSHRHEFRVRASARAVCFVDVGSGVGRSRGPGGSEGSVWEGAALGCTPTRP